MNRKFSTRNPLITRGQYGEIQDFGGGAFVYADPRDNPVFVARNPEVKGTPIPVPQPETVADASPAAFLSRINKDKQDFESTLGSRPEEPTLESIVAAKRAAAQAQADLITQQFNKTIASARSEGDKRAARTDAISRASGLSGSSFASTRANETAEANLKDIQFIEKERDAKIFAILNDVADRASEEYRAQRELFLKENEARFDRIEAFNKKVQERVVNEVAAIAATGISFEDFKTKYGNVIPQLLEEGDLTEDGLKARFIAAAPQGTVINKDKPMVVNGQATYIYQKTDPRTGLPSFETVSVKLPEGYTEDNIRNVVTRDDGIYLINNDGTYKVIGSPKGTGGTGGRVPVEGAPSFEDYLKAAEETARQTFAPAARDELRKQYEAAYTAPAGGDTKFTATEKKKLEQAGLLNASRQEQLDFLFKKKDSGSSASDMSDEEFLKFLRGES